MSHISVALKRTLGSFVLDVNFNAPTSAICALFGPSAAGKTTILRCIAGLERLDHACITVDGLCWQDEKNDIFIPAHQRNLAYIFQEGNLFTHLSVHENLRYGFARVPKNERHIAYDHAVELLALAPLLKRRVATLSGGERQRIAIGRALLSNPRLLLMDEPFAALDESGKLDILRQFQLLQKEMSLSVIMVSHSLEDVALLAHYLILVERGRVSAHGDLTSLMTRLDLPLARAENANAIVDGVIRAHEPEFNLSIVQFDGGELTVAQIEAPVGAHVRLRIYARDVSMTLSPVQYSSALNQLCARILEIAEDGPGRCMIRLQAGTTELLARITQKSVAILGLQVDLTVYLQVKSVALAF